MTKFSKTSLKKLRFHLEKLNNTKTNYNYNSISIKPKILNHLSITTRNKNLITSLLTELLFFDFELSKVLNKRTTNTKSLVINKILNKKRFFHTSKVYDTSYLLYNKNIQLESNRTKNYYLLIKKIQAKLALFISEGKKTNLIFVFLNTINKLFLIIKKAIIDKWYIYIARLLVISLLHFIPFVQLTTTLLYTQPNKQIVHQIISYLLNFAPILVPLLNFISPILNQDTISFLILVPYLYFFIYSFRKYNISRKIAYQGSFALALMLFRYSLLLSQEAVSVIFKFAKRFFFLKNYQNIELLRDDLKFYIDDLEELRTYREEFFQLGESIFSLQDITKVTKIWETTTIFSLLAVIALFYNYMYFIFRGKKPIIPVVTTTVQRMMIDRNSKES